MPYFLVCTNKPPGARTSSVLFFKKKKETEVLYARYSEQGLQLKVLNKCEEFISFKTKQNKTKQNKKRSQGTQGWGQSCSCILQKMDEMLELIRKHLVGMPLGAGSRAGVPKSVGWVHWLWRLTLPGSLGSPICKLGWTVPCASPDTAPQQ